VGTSLKATNTAQAQTGQLQISVTFSDEYRKPKRCWSTLPQSLFTRAEQQRASLTAIRQPTLRLGRFAGQSKRGIGIALSLPQRDFCSVRRFGDFTFPRCAHTARGINLLDMHGRLRYDFDREQNNLLQPRSWAIRRTLAGLGLFKTL
jgi:hypothetical protein